MEQDRFYDEANKGKNSADIWISATCIILVAFYFVTGAFSSIVSTIIGFAGGIWHPDVYSTAAPERWKYYWSVFYGWTSGSFFGLAGLYFVQTKLRKRPFSRLLTVAKSFRFRRALFAAILFLALKLVSIFVQSLYLGNADVPVWSEPQSVPGFTIERTDLPIINYVFIAPLLASLIVMFIVFQEALFRGFIDQALTCKFKQTLPAFFVSACLFTLWHIWSYDTFYGVVPYFIGIFIIGFSMSIISSVDEGLEAVIGIQIMWSLLVNLGIGTTIILLPTTTLWTLGEPKYTAAHILETLIICIALITILKVWRVGTLDGNENK